MNENGIAKGSSIDSPEGSSETRVSIQETHDATSSEGESVHMTVVDGKMYEGKFVSSTDKTVVTKMPNGTIEEHPKKSLT